MSERRVTRSRSSITPRKTPNYLSCICEECGKVFPTNKLVQKHYKKFHGSCRHRCDHCSVGYKTAIFLKKHNELYHPKKINRSCTRCPTQVFYSERHFQSHRGNHEFNERNSVRQIDGFRLKVEPEESIIEASPKGPSVPLAPATSSTSPTPVTSLPNTSTPLKHLPMTTAASSNGMFNYKARSIVPKLPRGASTAAAAYRPQLISPVSPSFGQQQQQQQLLPRPEMPAARYCSFCKMIFIKTEKNYLEHMKSHSDKLGQAGSSQVPVQATSTTTTTTTPVKSCRKFTTPKPTTTSLSSSSMTAKSVVNSAKLTPPILRQSLASSPFKAKQSPKITEAQALAGYKEIPIVAVVNATEIGKEVQPEESNDYICSVSMCTFKTSASDSRGIQQHDAVHKAISSHIIEQLQTTSTYTPMQPPQPIPSTQFQSRDGRWYLTNPTSNVTTTLTTNSLPVTPLQSSTLTSSSSIPEVIDLEAEDDSNSMPPPPPPLPSKAVYSSPSTPIPTSNPATTKSPPAAHLRCTLCNYRVTCNRVMRKHIAANHPGIKNIVTRVFAPIPLLKHSLGIRTTQPRSQFRRPVSTSSSAEVECIDLD